MKQQYFLKTFTEAREEIEVKKKDRSKYKEFMQSLDSKGDDVRASSAEHRDHEDSSSSSSDEAASAAAPSEEDIAIGDVSIGGSDEEEHLDDSAVDRVKYFSALRYSTQRNA